MEDKAGVTGGTLILGFTAWLWLLPAACLYTGHSVSDFFQGVLTLSITSGAIILAFLTFLTSVLGILGKQVSFIVEKLFVGPTSSPKKWYASKIGHVGPEQWNAAQKQSWASPQAHKDFESSKLAIELSRALMLNASIALVVFAIAVAVRVWPVHFTLLLSIATVVLLLGVVSWWLGTTTHQAMVRVASEIENSKNESNSAGANPAVHTDAAR